MYLISSHWSSLDSRPLKYQLFEACSRANTKWCNLSSDPSPATTSGWLLKSVCTESTPLIMVLFGPAFQLRDLVKGLAAKLGNGNNIITVYKIVIKSIQKQKSQYIDFVQIRTMAMCSAISSRHVPPHCRAPGHTAPGTGQEYIRNRSKPGSDWRRTCLHFKNQKTWRFSQALLFLPFIYRVGQGFAKQNDSLCMILLCCRDLQPKKQPNELAVGIFNLRRTNPIRQSGQVSQP